MKFFKENPIFCIVLIVLLLAFAGGVYMDYTAYGKSETHENEEENAQRKLKNALNLKPAPTEANLELAKANVAALKEALRQQIETTKGTNPELINDSVPADGTELLFQLRGYRDELMRDAARTIPINVNENSVADGNIPNPGVKIPNDFAFGFSRYLNTGTPPPAAAVKGIYLQKQILDYILDELLDTRPIEIKAVQREYVGTPTAAHRNAAAVASQQAGQSGSGNQQSSITDEFKVGKETAAVKDVINTMGFRIVFTGYTENLRQFMKSLEDFELPLVVRSVEVKPLESSVRGGANSGTGSRNNRNTGGGLDAIFGSTAPAANTAQVQKVQEPVVAENISEYTVVIEYITVVLK